MRPLRRSHTPFRGWCWRGARLEPREAAAYLPGAGLRHLGWPTARTGPFLDFPVILRIYAQDACRSHDDPERILFPGDEVFSVQEALAMPDGRLVLWLDQFGADARGAALATRQRAFREDLPGAPLPAPDPDLEAAWSEPFARWDPYARAGDAPLQGPLYDPEAVVRRLLATTEMDREPILAVLEALGRRLGLPGQRSVPVEHPARLHALRQLLGEPCSLSDGPDLACLQRLSGQDRLSVRRVVAADAKVRRELTDSRPLPPDNWDGQPWEDRIRPWPEPPLDPEDDLDRALDRLREQLRRQCMRPRVLDRQGNGALLTFSFAGEPCLAHLGAFREPSRLREAGSHPEAPPEAPLLARLQPLAAARGAHALRVRGWVRHDRDWSWAALQGLDDFIRSVQDTPERWKRHMLGGIPGPAWLERAGRLSVLGFRIGSSGWPYIQLDGADLELPPGRAWPITGAPADPCELCRSLTTDDACWILTCECGDRACAGITGGALVARDGGLVVWRSPDHPWKPLAVFQARQYRSAVLRMVRKILHRPPGDPPMNRGGADFLDDLRCDRARVLAGCRWFHRPCD